MSDKNNKNLNEPISISLKVVIYLGIVSGILIGSWEIVNNIPKYEYFERRGEMFMINKINGDVFIQNTGNESLLKYGHRPFNLFGKISEITYEDEYYGRNKKIK